MKSNTVSIEIEPKKVMCKFILLRDCLYLFFPTKHLLGIVSCYRSPVMVKLNDNKVNDYPVSCKNVFKRADIAYEENKLIIRTGNKIKDITHIELADFKNIIT